MVKKIKKPSSVLMRDVPNGLTRVCSGQEAFERFLYFPIDFAPNPKLL